ncbi:MAG TPA: three-Cys-motif partner protein TcmP [Candidatus Ozemobacteraceae bacterium]|nr:three-Cys-motif partner protein TcmP [Candidatus Ozemobacteraceae bacterium]
MVEHSGKGNPFGGNWTDAKLRVLAKYLQAFTTALSRQSFITGYIDAFAGTGYREPVRDRDDADPAQGVLFPDLATPDTQTLLDGSARIALQVSPRFSRYIFIERDSQRCSHLNALKSEFPALADDIRIFQGDANTHIQAICQTSWKNHRAVLFLDPYGMQVEWQTIEAIAGTKAIDLWLLFPLGMGVNRLLPRSGNIPDGWRRRLDLLLGTSDWYDEFYRVEASPDLFNSEQAHVIKATMDTIARYFVKRLKSIFPEVTEEPGILKNSSNNPLYLFCFAAGNQKGGKIGLKIANDILKGIR